MAATSRATSPNTGVVTKVAIWLIVPNSADADNGARQDSGATADDGDEGFGDVGDADGRDHARDRRQHAAGQPGSAAPTPKVIE